MANPKPTRADLQAMMTMEPKRAVEYLKRKGFQITWDSHEMEAAAHARAFTAVKATRLDILQDLKNGLKGRNLREYQKDLEPILRAKGWWGKKEVLDADTGEVTKVELGSPRRLKTIYQTNMQSAYINMQSAYMAGRYADAVESQDSHPYAMYIAVQDASTRSSHAAMHGRVFRLDDPVWQQQPPYALIRRESLNQIKSFGRYGCVSCLHEHTGQRFKPAPTPSSAPSEQSCGRVPPSCGKSVILLRPLQRNQKAFIALLTRNLSRRASVGSR